ncbi:MAG: ABC transporter permease [Acetobacter sp.]|uniref:ABC transporter permease n=1 Tax=Acetobacter sp. TaxID=440 RepID=UPI0039ED0CFD
MKMHPLIGFCLTRVRAAVLTMLAVSLLLYAVLELDSGTVAVKVLGAFSTDGQRVIWLHQNGYDDGFFLRYWRWFSGFLIGDWGFSTHYRVPVLSLVLQRLGATALLAFLVLLFMVPLGLGLGILSGIMAGRRTDRVISVMAIITTSIPDYASCSFLSAIFVVGLQWLPGASTMTDGFNLRQFALPVAVLVLYSSGYVIRITRAAISVEMGRPYVRTARLKGADYSYIVLRHVVRNALSAPLTVIMLQIPWLMSGVIVVEVFFGYRGFGSLLYDGALNSDFPVIEACAMLSVAVVTTSQLLSELATALLDPRQRSVLLPYRRKSTELPAVTNTRDAVL